MIGPAYAPTSTGGRYSAPCVLFFDWCAEQLRYCNQNPFNTGIRVLVYSVYGQAIQMKLQYLIQMDFPACFQFLRWLQVKKAKVNA